MADGAGVPSPLVPSGPGVAALESVALSPVEAGRVEGASGTGESTVSLVSLSGESSLTGTGLRPKASRSFAGARLRETIRVDLAPDLRRPLADLAGGAMARTATGSWWC